MRKTFGDLFHLFFFSQHFILLATLPFHWPIQLYFHFETDQTLNYGARSYDVYIFLFAGRQTENISSIALFPFLDLSVLFFSFAFDSLWFPLIRVIPLFLVPILSNFFRHRLCLSYFTSCLVWWSLHSLVKSFNFAQYRLKYFYPPVLSNTNFPFGEIVNVIYLQHPATEKKPFRLLQFTITNSSLFISIPSPTL